METKVIMLFFLFGAVGVFAEKESSEENVSEEYEFGGNFQCGHNTNGNSFDYPVPEALLPAKEPYSNDSLLLQPGKVDAYLVSFQKQMNTLSVSAARNFQSMMEIIDNKKEKSLQSLKNKYETTKIRLDDHQKDEIRKAVQDGKDTNEIEKCLEEGKIDFKTEMKEDLESALECITNAIEEIKNILQESRKDFFEAFNATLVNGENQAEDVKTCLNKKNGLCVQEGMFFFQDIINMMIEEKDYNFDIAENAIEAQRAEVEECYEEFMESLREKEDFCTEMISICADSPGNSKLKEENEENEEKGEEEKKEETEEEEEKQEEVTKEEKEKV